MQRSEYEDQSLLNEGSGDSVVYNSRACGGQAHAVSEKKGISWHYLSTAVSISYFISYVDTDLLRKGWSL